MIGASEKSKSLSAAWSIMVGLAIGFSGCIFDNDEKDGGISPMPIFPMHHVTPAWSRQGLIAYWDAGIVCVNPSGSYRVLPQLAGIWILNPRTGERRRLLEGFWVSPAWSPDGLWLAAVRDPNTNPQIWVTPTNSANLTQLTFEGMNFAPDWSPDGQWIAYDSNQQGDTRIWVMRPDGSEKHAIAQEADSPAWSPDGGLIVHVGYPIHYPDPGPYSEIFFMNVDGSNDTRLTQNQADDRSPRFSPGRQHITYSSQLKTGDILPEIWIMNADGTAPRQLTQHGGTHPAWSPDGTEIVFTREEWRTNTPQNGTLWIINVETGQEYQLLCKWPERCEWPSSLRDSAAVWPPSAGHPRRDPRSAGARGFERRPRYSPRRCRFTPWPAGPVGFCRPCSRS